MRVGTLDNENIKRKARALMKMIQKRKWEYCVFKRPSNKVEN